MKKLQQLLSYYKQIHFSKNLYLAVAFSFLLAGCEKEITPNRDGIVVKGSTDAIPSQYFDWDNSDFLPGTNIHIPWFVGASGSITNTYDADVYSDHKAADGWDMLYSRLSPPAPFFILYNKYRGLMRIYHYNDNQTMTLSSHITAGLNWSGNGIGSNKVLNYLGKDIVDVNTSPTSYYSIEPSPINEAPVSANKWYMLQYEIAYDPTITRTTSQTPPTLTWFLNYHNITTFNFGGTIKGKLTGSTGSSNLTRQTIESNLTSIASSLGTLGLGVLGSAKLDNDNMGLSPTVYEGLKAGFKSGISSAVSGTPAKIFNLLSAILGGSRGGATGVTNISANVQITGSSSSNGSLISGCSIYMPGSLQTDNNGNYYVTTGLLPLHNYNLGVFNLSSKPIVPIISNQTWWNDDPEYPGYITQIIVGSRDNSDKIVINPEVLAIANVQLVQQDIIINGDAQDYNYSWPDDHDATIEPAGYVNPTYMQLNCRYTNITKAVRYTIKVTPHDTSIPPSLIVKTFWAD